MAPNSKEFVPPFERMTDAINVTMLHLRTGSVWSSLKLTHANPQTVATRLMACFIKEG